MRINPETDRQSADETAQRSEASAKSPSWPLALASVGICLATAVAIVLIGILA